MAVDFIDTYPYRTKPSPVDREQVFVMESGKLRRLAPHENPVSDLAVIFEQLETAELEAVSQFMTDHVDDQIVVQTVDGTDWVGNFVKRSLNWTELSGTQFMAQLQLRATIPTSPDPISVFAVSSQMQGEQTAAWEKPEDNGVDITGYRLRHREVGTANWTETDVVGENTLTANTTYARGTVVEYRVAPRYGVNEVGVYSRRIEFTAPGIPDSLIPTLFAQVGGFTGAWSPPVDHGSPITEYRLRYRETGTAAWTNVNGIDPTARTHTITGLNENDEYDVQVAAVNALGAAMFTGMQSITTVSQTTQLGGSQNPWIINDPLNYTDVDILPFLLDGHGVANATYFRFVVPAGSGGDYTIRLTADPTSSNWQLSEDDGTPASIGPDGSEEYEVSLSAGDTYTFRVWAHDATALNPTGLQLSIDATTATEPGVPPSFIYELAYGESDILFAGASWAAPSNGGSPILDYEIEYQWRSSGGQYTDANRRTYTRTTLFHSINVVQISGNINLGYRVRARVRARNSVGYGNYTDWIEDTVVLP